MNNPPTEQLLSNTAFSNDEDLYENSSSGNKPKNKTFASSQELMQNSQQHNYGYFSSPSSSICQLNSGGQQQQQQPQRSRTRERLQDPLKILETIRNSCSNLNSLTDLTQGDNRRNKMHTNKKATNEADGNSNDTVISFSFYAAVEEASRQAKFPLRFAISCGLMRLFLYAR